MRLSELQMKKTSSYLLDISKLVFGATIIPLFVPGNEFSLITASGAVIAIFTFGVGLLFLKNIQYHG